MGPLTDLEPPSEGITGFRLALGCGDFGFRGLLMIIAHQTQNTVSRPRLSNSHHSRTALSSDSNHNTLPPHDRRSLYSILPGYIPRQMTPSTAYAQHPSTRPCSVTNKLPMAPVALAPAEELETLKYQASPPYRQRPQTPVIRKRSTLARPLSHYYQPQRPGS